LNLDIEYAFEKHRHTEITIQRNRTSAVGVEGVELGFVGRDCVGVQRATVADHVHHILRHVDFLVSGEVL
jgi:hypothetical protein